MSSILSQKDFSFKFIPYLPQDAGYNIQTYLSSDIMRSNLTQLNDNSQAQRVEILEIMNDDLSNLLKMQFNDFLDNIVRADIEKYICTFLQFSRRSTDNLFSFNFNDKESNTTNKGGEGKIDLFGIDELSQSIRRKIFLLFYRLTDLKQIALKFGEDQNEQIKKYGQWIYDQWIFDVPRIFDFCSIYNSSNPLITKQIVSFIYKIQPKYDEDLKHAMDLVTYYVFFYILAQNKIFKIFLFFEKMKQKMTEICHFYHSMDPDLKLSENKTLNTLDALSNDINLIKEILVNWFSLLQSYEYFGTVCFELGILQLMVVMIDVTFPIIQVCKIIKRQKKIDIYSSTTIIKSSKHSHIISLSI